MEDERGPLAGGQDLHGGDKRQLHALALVVAGLRSGLRVGDPRVGLDPDGLGRC